MTLQKKMPGGMRPHTGQIEISMTAWIIRVHALMRNHLRSAVSKNLWTDRHSRNLPDINR